MNEIFLDTETTGLSYKENHRIVEIACIETQDLIPTKKIFHKLINPERSVPDEAFKIHGFSTDFLKTKEEDLNSSGFFFGRSKFAVSNKYSFNKLNCQKCGLCHYGCPYECMFNAKNLLNTIIEKFPNELTYNQSIFVKTYKRKWQTNLPKDLFVVP